MRTLLMLRRAARGPLDRVSGLAPSVFSSTSRIASSSRRMCTVRLAWISSIGSSFSSSAPEGLGLALPFLCFFSAAFNGSVKAACAMPFLTLPQASLPLQGLGSLNLLC